MAFQLTLNDELIHVTDVDPNTTLLAFLRSRGLVGTKEGCAEGECGACAVVLTRPRGEGARYEAVNACLVLLASVADGEVRTVEGVARQSELHPVQRAMVEHGASQCGYCTPGFVMSLYAEYYRADRESTDVEAIAGNLCRCTGYRPIRDAARSLPAAAGDDAALVRLARSAPVPSMLEHRSEDRFVVRPRSLAELWPVLARVPNAKLVAGGTDVVVEMNQLHRRHQALVLLDQVAELREIADEPTYLSVGAAIPLRELEHSLRGRIRALDMLWPLFASRLVRAQATLGGNLVTASPIGDASPVLLALDAELVLASERGERSVALCDFFTGYRRTLLEQGEVVRAIRIPKPFASFTRFDKVSKRVSDDISSVSAAFALRMEGARCREARVAYGGVAEHPLRLRAVEDVLRGAVLDAATLSRAQITLRASIQPIDDVRASAAYRMRVAEALLARAFDDAALREATP